MQKALITPTMGKLVNEAMCEPGERRTLFFIGGEGEQTEVRQDQTESVEDGRVATESPPDDHDPGEHRQAAS